MDWFAPRRVMRGLARPAGALLLVAGAVTGLATVADRPTSNADNPHFLNAFDVTQVQSDAVLNQTAGDRTGRLTVTERLTGSFDGSRRHLVRVFPTDVSGHRMPVTVLDVTRPNGTPATWHAEPEGDALVLRVEAEPEDSEGTFTLTYRRDGVVVDTPAGIRVVWDVKPGEWPEAATVAGTLTVPGSLAAQEPTTECTAAGTPCALTSDTTTDGSQTHAIPALTAGADDEVSMAVGLAPGLITPNADPVGGPGNAALIGIGAGALTLAGAGAAFAASRRRRGTHESVDLLETILPERLSPAMAGGLLGSPGRGIVGQLLAAAVAGHVRLRVGDEDVLVELVDWPEGLSPEADAALSVLAPRTKGEIRSVGGGVRLATEATLAQIRDAPERARLVRRPDRPRAARRLGVAGLGAAIVIPWYAHAQDASFLVGAGSLTAVLAALGVGYGTIYEWQSYTARGREALGQLEGLARYVRLPRAERITFLRNASGQEVADSHEALIYQQLVPYAAVLGLVDTWREQVAESLGSDPAWLPMDQLGRVLAAVDADTLAERLDGILMPVERRPTVSHYSQLYGVTSEPGRHSSSGMGGPSSGR